MRALGKFSAEPRDLYGPLEHRVIKVRVAAVEVLPDIAARVPEREFVGIKKRLRDRKDPTVAAAIARLPEHLRP